MWAKLTKVQSAQERSTTANSFRSLTGLMFIIMWPVALSNWRCFNLRVKIIYMWSPSPALCVDKGFQNLEGHCEKWWQGAFLLFNAFRLNIFSFLSLFIQFFHLTVTRLSALNALTAQCVNVYLSATNCMWWQTVIVQVKSRGWWVVQGLQFWNSSSENTGGQSSGHLRGIKWNRGVK